MLAARLGDGRFINYQQHRARRTAVPESGESDDGPSSGRTAPDRSAAGSRLEHWLEWKQKCAHGLCSAEARHALTAFAAMRFDQFARTYAHRTNASVDSVRSAGKDGWHLLETYMMTRNNRQGKRYKDWLFSRTAEGDNALDVLAGGATLLMRDVVRDILCHEYGPAQVVSLSAVVRREGGSAITLEDLLPGAVSPSDEVAARELERMAARHAGRFFENLSHREKVAVLAREIGISLAHPAVVGAAGCSKSVLVEALFKAVERAASNLKEEYSTDDPEVVRALTAMTIRDLSQRVRSWGEADPGCAELINVAEVR